MKLSDSCEMYISSLEETKHSKPDLRTPAMLWQWPQGSQLSEGAEGLRTPAMLWQWPRGSQLPERTEGLRTCISLAMAVEFTIA